MDVLDIDREKQRVLLRFEAKPIRILQSDKDWNIIAQMERNGYLRRLKGYGDWNKYELTHQGEEFLRASRQVSIAAPTIILKPYMPIQPEPNTAPMKKAVGLERIVLVIKWPVTWLKANANNISVQVVATVISTLIIILIGLWFGLKQ